MSVFIGYPSFMAYQMMKGKKGNNDGFPSIPGMIARYSASGLTNEQMAANPVWVDKTGNGHDIQLKNFSWKGMSGVGGYVTNKDIYEYDLDRYSYTFIENSAKVHDFYIVFELIGYDENFKDGFNLDVRSISQGLKYRKTYTKNGIYIFQYKDEEGLDDLFAIGYNGNGGARSNFTVKVLPLYPGALVFDGVDDYGVCDNFPILTKEKGYTVVALRKWLTPETKIINEVLLGNFKNNPIWIGANLGAFQFEVKYNVSKKVQTDRFGMGNNITLNNNHLFSYQISNSYNGSILRLGSNVGGNFFTVGCGGDQFYANATIWELVFLDHDATEEELTKIKDYFVKTYPWLFPDQAWTVVGKTNEDEDRATIANITGNGNDLVLSNVAFSENSGYGSYPFGMNVWNPDYIADQPYGTVHYPNDSKSYATTVKNNATNFRIKFRLRGLPEGGSFLIRVFDMNDLNTVLKTYTYTENGIHEFVYNDPNKPARIILYNGNTPSNISEFYLDIIPEYEGYLVTDGVDDKITSSIFEMGNDWTVIGDWELINTGKKDNAGIVKFDSIVIYNYNPILINIKNGRNNLIPDQNTVNAICSDGRIYSKDWKESIYNEETESTSKNLLTIGYSGNSYTKIAFKNLAIYPTVLSKEDCIKAYNYLQTLKAK